ncbi:tetratricopeptide repeat protein [Bradyrhizobium jicamae]|uniref:tetratricopeptide repeat protein n=1 Tax=Bradyrhizobium jicamae TaxID=280332 RepID=UPI001BA4EB27|nr:tetratricopeptide repeat protein [Bradyrhizobium jicamae]MBR0755398.1 tetratricopeptide repeat protein [Bradyrhizobium jicamae]
MIRVVAVATVLGTLVAGVVLYTKSLPQWQIKPPFGGLDRKAETAITPEAWPICTTMVSVVASDADWAQLDPDFKAGKRALVAEDWTGAIKAFELAALRDPLNADTQNYIGYAYRRLRQLGPAIGHYQRALTLNPRHRSAHEHLGEAYLVLGEPDKAEQLLTALEDLCLIPCEEYDDLKRAIAAYKRLAAR